MQLANDIVERWEARKFAVLKSGLLYPFLTLECSSRSSTVLFLFSRSRRSKLRMPSTAPLSSSSSIRPVPPPPTPHSAPASVPSDPSVQPLSSVLPPVLPSETAGAARLERSSEENQLLRDERAAQRKASKLAKRAAKPPVVEEVLFLHRKWSYVAEPAGQPTGGLQVKIMSWNMLAQALIRRELFPGSDFLKKDRIPALMQEVLQVGADIVCLQEVDRIEDHSPALAQDHDFVYHIGYPDKPHGVAIAWKRSRFDKVGQHAGRLDESPLFPPPLSVSATLTTPYDLGSATQEAESPTRQELGLSRSTRNVFSLVALKFKDREGGIIIATTHLFWHPTAAYERARQTGILLSSVSTCCIHISCKAKEELMPNPMQARRYRDHGNNGAWRDWELVIAGDFNTQPNEVGLAFSNLVDEFSS